MHGMVGAICAAEILVDLVGSSSLFREVEVVGVAIGSLRAGLKARCPPFFVVFVVVCFMWMGRMGHGCLFGTD